MSRASRQKQVRLWHRRLTPIVGIQLLLWTIGGTYFSWVRLDVVRSETDIVEQEPTNLKYENFLAQIPPIIRNSELTHVKQIKLGKLLNTPVYRFIQDDTRAETYDAITGEKVSPISPELAQAIAEKDFAPEVPVISVEKITAHKPGGEYRGPLPAWRINFDNWKASALYVSAQTGEVVARRSFIWRTFDFLWMFHIMDYNERDNFNNWLLRILSLLSLVTIGTGYYLWWLTTPKTRRVSKGKR